jgi:hypothetical protein
MNEVQDLLRSLYEEVQAALDSLDQGDLESVRASLTALSVEIGEQLDSDDDG